ncbi:MAG: hypothetical protein ACE5E6_01850 [Phycisphaerae bacterium]
MNVTRLDVDRPTGLIRHAMTWLWVAGAVAVLAARPATAQIETLLEDFEFASSNEAAAAGVIDLTSPANQPALYLFGSDENASPNEPGGLYSIGTDAIFCINPDAACVGGTFIGFRRLVDPVRFPSTCAGGHYMPLAHTYGDPDHPGAVPPDFPLSALVPVWDAYGDGGFADGDTGTHLWLKLIDCEGEAFEYINYSEESLYSELWSFDVIQGQNVIRISPDSLVDVPDGDRLLTEIAAMDVLIQDEDFPPTAAGLWYVDYLRIVEPEQSAIPGDGDGDGDVDLLDHAAFTACLSGPGTAAAAGCDGFDVDGDADVDLADWARLQIAFGIGL